MPVSMEESGWGQHTNDYKVQPELPCPYQRQCRSCGFEQTDVVGQPQYCPKCGGSAWERFAIPGAFLLRTDRKKPSTRRNTNNAWAIWQADRKKESEPQPGFNVSR